MYLIRYTDKSDGNRHTVFESDYEALIERLNRLRNKIDLTKRLVIDSKQPLPHKG